MSKNVRILKRNKIISHSRIVIILLILLIIPLAYDENLNEDLLESTKNGQTSLVVSLLKAIVCANTKNNQERTALKFAINQGHIEIVELLKKTSAKE